MSKYCFVIPCFQHSFTLEPILQKIGHFDFPVFIVDDGSELIHQKELKRLEAKYNFVHRLRHEQNQGKGAAIKTGLIAAQSAGFTHAIQVDSDGQHDLSQISKLVELSIKHPEHLISGYPQYDESVPKSRFVGRYITHFWVWIETLSFEIKDTMCGFRVYPLDAVVLLLKKVHLGRRMDFDIEIMVRMYWKGTRISFLPVRVEYPVGGVSHFKLFRDNLIISWMHTRLFFGMLGRLPVLLWRKIKGHRAQRSWHKIDEVGTELGMRSLIVIYRLLGRKVIDALLYPISLYYAWFGRQARSSSLELQTRLSDFTSGRGKKFSFSEHVFAFASSIVDKFAVWMGDIKYQDLNGDDVKKLHDIAKLSTGALFITSHYGNIEICRALGRTSNIRFNALVYHGNAKKFNAAVEKISGQAHMNLISVEKFGSDMAFLLKDKVEKGEWIFIAGDRRSINNEERVIDINLLGKNAAVAEGPFVLAYLLDVPVFAIHCYRQGRQFRIQTRQLSGLPQRCAKTKRDWMKALASDFAQELDSLIIQDPLQWFNFYNFWRMT